MTLSIEMSHAARLLAERDAEIARLRAHESAAPQTNDSALRAELKRVNEELRSLRSHHARLRAELIRHVHHRRLAELGIEEGDE